MKKEKSERRIDWREFGRFLKMVVDMFTIIKEEFKTAEVGPEIIEWLLNHEDGKNHFRDIVCASAEKYNEYRTEHREEELEKSRKQPLVAEVDLDQEPETPFAGAIRGIHLKQGKVRVEYRPDEDELYIDGVKVILWLSEEQKSGGLVKGEKLQLETLSNKPLNARLGDFLYENQQFVPHKWQGHLIFFWGTDWSVPDGDRYVRDLYWDGSRWGRYCSWLEIDWDSRYPSASLAS